MNEKTKRDEEEFCFTKVILENNKLDSCVFKIHS